MLIWPLADDMPPKLRSGLEPPGGLSLLRQPSRLLLHSAINHRSTGTGPVVAFFWGCGFLAVNHRPTGTGPMVALRAAPSHHP
ncbi:MAG: hypothetical protein V3T83_19830 [Acidobacteriota bacterium]